MTTSTGSVNITWLTQNPVAGGRNPFQECWDAAGRRSSSWSPPGKRERKRLIFFGVCIKPIKSLTRGLRCFTQLPTIGSLASGFQGLCAASEQLGSIYLKLLLGLWKPGFPPNFLARTSSSACWCSHTLLCPRVPSLLPFAVHTPRISSM